MGIPLISLDFERRKYQTNKILVLLLHFQNILKQKQNDTDFLKTLNSIP